MKATTTPFDHELVLPPRGRRRPKRVLVSARTLAPIERTARTVDGPQEQGGLWVALVAEPAQLSWKPVPIQGVPLSLRENDGKPHVVVRELHCPDVAWAPGGGGPRAPIAYVRVPAGACAFLYHRGTHRHLVMKPGVHALSGEPPPRAGGDTSGAPSTAAACPASLALRAQRHIEVLRSAVCRRLAPQRVGSSSPSPRWLRMARSVALRP